MEYIIIKSYKKQRIIKHDIDEEKKERNLKIKVS